MVNRMPRVKPTWWRAPQHDKCFADAWMHSKTGKVIWVAVGHDPNLEDRDA